MPNYVYNCFIIFNLIHLYKLITLEKVDGHQLTIPAFKLTMTKDNNLHIYL